MQGQDITGRNQRMQHDLSQYKQVVPYRKEGGKIYVKHRMKTRWDVLIQRAYKDQISQYVNSRSCYIAESPPVTAENLTLCLSWMYVLELYLPTCQPLSVRSIRMHSADARQLTRSQHRGPLFTADLMKGVCSHI